MSVEDTLVIRYVRLCECGKVAGHDSVCRSHRLAVAAKLDAARDESESRDREEHYRGRLVRFNALERDRRMGMLGLDLAAEVRREMLTASTVKAGSPEPSRGGEDERIGPPRQQLLTDDPRWVLQERMLHRHALALRELVDEARGLSRSAAVAGLSAEEKDKAIEDEGVGLTASEVFFRLGPEYGSESYIRRLRRARGLDGRGYPKAQA